MGRHYEQLTPEERATIMLMTSQQCSARYIARTLHRSASTIARELKRFSCWQDRPSVVSDTGCAYDARTAGLRARRQRFKPRRCSKLEVDTIIFVVLQHFLAERCSPSQIAGTRKVMWPDDLQRTVSHETIYNCTYAMHRWEKRKDLITCLRRAQAKLMPRSRGEDRRGQLPDVLSIHVRPPEADDRAFPGHWEGDSIKGAGNRSAVGVLVERSSRLVMLAKMADATAASALEAFTAKLRSIAEPIRRTLTYDQGKEMARHAELTVNTGIQVYFRDLRSPRATGQLREHQRSDPAVPVQGYGPVGLQPPQLDAIADKLNNRPSAIHGYPPISVY